jgi:hypothetical protein
VSADQMVEHPPHYTKGGIECIAAIRAALTPDEYRGYLKGAILKYAWRERHKNRLQDIKKLRWYANELVAHLETSLLINEDQ